jgi:hypothetical protein
MTVIEHLDDQLTLRKGDVKAKLTKIRGLLVAAQAERDAASGLVDVGGQDRRSQAEDD